MDTLLEGSEQLEQELTPEPIAAPAAGSLLLHAALAVVLLTWGMLSGLFHHNQWGAVGVGGAIQVTMTSALPLPSDQPLNQNVLSTETPSQAPAEPTPKTSHAEDETAIPIVGKQKKPEQQTERRTQTHQPPPKPDNRARYGEQEGSSIPRSIQAQGFTSGKTTVEDSSFGSLFAWYVEQINRKMAANWNRFEVDPRTPRGTKAYIQFAIHRDGSLSNVQMEQSSGSPTLDNSCLRAAQRVDTFGQLPAQYNQSTVMTSYYCEY
jgi:protein TonB